MKLVKSAGEKRSISFDDIFCANSKVIGSDLRRRFRKLNTEYVCENCGNIGIHDDKPLSLHMDHKNGINNDNRLENLRWLCPNCHSQTITYSRTKKKTIRLPKLSPTVFNKTEVRGKYVELTCEVCEKLFFRKASCVKRSKNVYVCSPECSRVFSIKNFDKHGTLSGYFKCPKPRCEPCKAAMATWKRNSKNGEKLVNKVEWPSDEELKRIVWEVPATKLANQLNISSSAIKKRCKKLGINTPGLGYWAKLNAS